MRKKDVFYCPRFKFYDGETGKKLLLVLNEPSEGQPYLIVLVTSQQKNRKDVPGCYHKEGYYFIKENETWFSENTWLLFRPIYAFDFAKVLTESFSNNLTYKDQITEDFYIKILNCMLNSKDVKRLYKQILKNELEVLDLDSELDPLSSL
ncbi:MAG: hypothetical protein KAJ14_12055 [Candidatus Omnitrophica bacterium]|nr:hypothetical protein [Candidatus Omnitrophota bacterium]